MRQPPLNAVPVEIDRLLVSGYTAMQFGRLQLAGAQLSAALAAAERCDSNAALLSALQLLGHLALRRGAGRDAAELHRRALAVCLRLGYLHGAASALHNLGIVALFGADEASAQYMIAVAYQLYGAVGDIAAQALTARNLLLLADVTATA